MSERALKREIQYRLVVTKVEPVKSIPASGGAVRYSHKVSFKDVHGYYYKADYVTDFPEQNEFIPGSSSTFRVIKFNDKMLPEISFIFNSIQEVEKTLILSESVPMQGTTYSHALTHAANILAAERQGTMDKVDDADVQRMLTWADEIDAWIIKKQTERITDDVAL